jgi:serine/threonine-protein kinase
VFEAEVTGSLEHPGIVPVYSLGAGADGRPYYAMRFIRGDTLAQAIADFHSAASRAADQGSRTLQLRKLLGRFVDVCNAIDYAHGRGVLHRDLKPANIVVGQHGETLVVDWGLAKAVGGKVDIGGEILRSAESRPLETVEGSALGTPSYMSPEQAAGQLESLGPASDVYCLGATLYCLLTGGPPFAGDQVVAVLEAARKGQFTPPRIVDRSIPPTLEAMVLKAMAFTPGDRYPTARALAEDLERWMADEPTTARREPRLDRARRWMRRHRTAVTAAAAALLAGLIGLGAVVVVQTHANTVLKSANLDLAAANARERARFQLALDAIKTFHTGVSQDILLKEKAFDSLRKKLLQGAADFYGRLQISLKGQSDRHSRAALAGAYGELGELTSQIGNQQQALELYRQSLELHKTLATDDGASSSDKLDVLRSLLEVGRAQQAIGDLESARSTFDQALVLAMSLYNQTWSKESRILLGRCYWQKGSVEIDLAHPETAIEADREASTIQHQLVRDYPDDAHLKVDLVNTYLSMGYNLIAHEHKPEEALVSFQRAREVQESVVASQPKHTTYLRILSECHSLTGLVYLEMGRPARARDALERAQPILRQLIDSNPNVKMFQDFLAGDLNNLGIAHARNGDRSKALESHLASRQILEKLAAADPDAPRVQRDLAGTLNNIGDLELALGRMSEASEAYAKARKQLERLIKAHPAAEDYQRGLAFSLTGQGRASLRQGQIRAAIASLRAANAIWERLKVSTNETLYALAGNHALIAEIAQRPGSSISAAEAETEVQRAIVCLRRPLQAGFRTIAEFRADADFRALVGRRELEDLLLDLQFPTDPFAQP